jgi:predicted RNase H-like HicB family nuclease
MNKTRREQIQKIIVQVENVKSMLELILEDEQFSFDNIPENLQCSQRGEESQEAIDNLEGAIENLEETIEQLQYI